MHPDNPVLAQMTREFTTNYVDNIRGEIKSGGEFWSRLAKYGPLTLRFQRTGAMFGMLQQSDTRTIFTQYSLARATSECTTILAQAGSAFHQAMKEDGEWQWNRAQE
jgi:hypothetical protein